MVEKNHTKQAIAHKAKYFIQLLQMPKLLNFIHVN